jgi:hypothetical protein
VKGRLDLAVSDLGPIQLKNIAEPVRVAQMNPDPEFDAALGRQAGVALDEAVLHLDGAEHGVE